MIRKLDQAFFGSHQKRLFYISLILLAAAAIATAFYATRLGSALSDDSYFYIKPARDILAGITPFFSPHYPPLVPLVLTLIGFMGIEPLQGIRLLNCTLFGVNVLLVGLIVYRITGSRGSGLVGAVLFLTSQVMVEVHSWAMSEALYITWMFAMILALEHYFSTKKMAGLVLSAVFAGCAALTRYSGIGLIFSGALALLLASGGHWLRTRLRNTIIFSGLACLLFAPYVVLYGDALQKIKSFEGNGWVLPGLSEMSEGFYNVLLWLMPGRFARDREALVLGAVIGLVLLAVSAYALFRRRAFQANWASVRQQPVYLAIVLLILANLFTLYQAHLSAVYRSPFDARLLSPTHALFLLLVTALLGLVWMKNGRILRIGIALLFVWVIFLYLPRSVDFVTRMHEQGAGFASTYWTDMDVARFFEKNRQREIFTTAPIGIYFSLGLETPGITPMNPDQLQDRLRNTNGFLIVFNSMPLDMYGYPAKEFLKGLVAVDEYSDCTVYQAAPD